MRATMNGIRMITRGIGCGLRGGILLAVAAAVLWVSVQGHQPMRVAAAPAGMSYFQFLGDRIEAAKIVQPARCGWGMLGSLAVLGPVYSLVYTHAGIHPDGLIARLTAADPAIPRGVAGASWQQVPRIWWGVVEQLSWRMLAEPAPYGCQLRPVVPIGKAQAQ